MKFIHKIAHLISPRESNNQKAKLLHSSSLIFLTFFLVFYQVVLTFLPKVGAKILGYAAQISPEEVVRLTNEKRIQAGLSPLEINPTLSSAALAKGTDMLNRDYWAHVAPDGTQPWKFFVDFGYKYRYAGENLARDFSNPSSAVDAWMSSPTHKENILSSKYKEIGIGVIEGDLAGVDTTIIVQFFGTKYLDTVPAVPVAKAQTSSVQPLVLSTPFPSARNILISPFTSTRSISLVVVGILLGVLVLDTLIVSRRRIVRIGGRAFAHLAFLGMIFAILLILRAGSIL